MTDSYDKDYMTKVSKEKNQRAEASDQLGITGFSFQSSDDAVAIVEKTIKDFETLLEDLKKKLKDMKKKKMKDTAAKS